MVQPSYPATSGDTVTSAPLDPGATCNLVVQWLIANWSITTDSPNGSFNLLLITQLVNICARFLDDHGTPHLRMRCASQPFRGHRPWPPWRTSHRADPGRPPISSRSYGRIRPRSGSSGHPCGARWAGAWGWWCMEGCRVGMVKFVFYYGCDG